MSLKLFNYAGTKIKYVEKINPLINLSNTKNYIEPFCGSASVFFNLEKSFSKYILNDKDRNVIRIFKSYADLNYNYFDLLKIYESIKDKFGDIRVNKEAYYNFRNDFNKNLWKTDSYEEGIAIRICFQTCLNSFARWGPNGFNQSFGNRFTNFLNENEFKIIQEKLSNNVILENLDFFDFINKYDLHDSLLFLDPPYLTMPVGFENISENFYIKFIDFCNNTSSNFIYTDVENNHLKFNKIILRENMNNTSPHRKNNIHKFSEVAYYNY